MTMLWKGNFVGIIMLKLGVKFYVSYFPKIANSINFRCTPHPGGCMILLKPFLQLHKYIAVN